MTEPSKPIHPPVQEADSHERIHTVGERIHNEITYRGVDWLLNTIFAVTFAHFAARTKIGREKIVEPLTKGWNYLLKPVFKDNHEGLKSASTWATKLMTIMFGGTVIIPPMIWLENHQNKKGIVKFFDRMIYGKEKVENDPEFQKSYQEIDHEPRKDFTTGMITRVIALTPIFAIALTPKLTSFFKAHLYDRLERASTWTAEKIGIRSEKMVRNFQAHGTDDGVAVSDWKFLHQTIGYDLGVTFIYSLIHEATYKFLARSREQRRIEKGVQHTLGEPAHSRVQNSAAERQGMDNIPDLPIHPAPSDSLTPQQNTDEKPHHTVSHVQHQHHAAPHTAAVATPA